MIAVNGLEGVSSSKHYIKSGIQKLKKKKADLIIVSMHAGIEKTSSLDVVQKSIAHYAVNKVPILSSATTRMSCRESKNTKVPISFTALQISALAATQIHRTKTP